MWFSTNVLGHDPWAVPREIMRSVDRPRSMTAVKACHASAKTHTAAEIALWAVLALRAIAITTAPTWPQVEKLLWGEIHKAHASARLPLGGMLNQVEYKIGPDCYAMGLSTDQGVRFQGFHAGHGKTILIILDEAPGVRPDIHEAIEGIRAGGDVRVLQLGNPVISSGPFYDAFGENRAAWKTFTIDAFDTPNLEGVTIEDLRAIPFDTSVNLSPEHEAFLDIAPRPYLVTRRWVWEKLHTWGEGSPMWESRVRGRFPDQGEDALLSLTLLEESRRAELPPIDREKPVIAGLDVAGPGEDETVLAIRQGAVLARERWWAMPDPRGEVLAELKQWNVEEVRVDSAGIGYYLARHLQDAGLRVVDVNVGSASRDSEKYANLKAELYWGLRMALEAGGVLGITDDVTISQLSGIRYSINARGQIVIESKADARKRGVKSPDRAEAIMLCYAGPQQPEVRIW